MAALNSIIDTYTPGLSTSSSLTCIFDQPPMSSLCRPGHLQAIHPIKPRSTTYSSSIYICYLHPFIHTALIHSFQVPKPFKCSLIRPTRQIPSYTSSPTTSFLILSVSDTPTKLLKHFILRTFTFLHSAVLLPHASATYKAVGTITPSLNFRYLFAFIPKLSIVQLTFKRSTCSILIHSVYHIPHKQQLKSIYTIQWIIALLDTMHKYCVS